MLIETMGKAMSKMMRTTAVAPPQAVNPSGAVAPSQDDIQDWQLVATEEPRRWRRAKPEQDVGRTLTDKRPDRLYAIGYCSTKLPQYEVLREWVATTFSDTDRRRNPNMLRNGFFEVKFHSSHARDRALARSPYDLEGTVITLFPWSKDPKRPKVPSKVTPEPHEPQRQNFEEIEGDQPVAVTISR
ncbi:hypothetical protein KC19_5G115100 [Ceratodon purpureus]|uniref:DUF4283 domain-containing protein n=1 Tax=Ceratodon purpureus TaxID=3225 RepID=A0A8T0I178_CERPU|nr:hypothetical protein KC19_5G115100 [Ceratodon purpureus]